MKRNYKIIIPLIALFTIFINFKLKAQNDPDKDKELVRLLQYALTQGHYQPHQIDDTFSKEMFTHFLEGIDPGKRFFLKSDIDEFKVFQDQLDDQIKTKDLSFYTMVINRFNQRVSESKAYYKEVLQSPFDFTKKETLDLDTDKKPYATTKIGLLNNWYKHLKAQTISRYYDKIKQQKEAEEDDEIKSKTLAQLEEDSRKATLKSTESLFNRIEELDDRDWFAVYLNTITQGFDPHTTYLPPIAKKRFDISMSGKLEGIGARLQKENDYVKVMSLISGGPAWKAGELEVGDIILKVAQGDKEPLDIVGMRLDDSIEFIKGKKGTEVRLTLKKVDGTIQTISIIRDVVELEDTFVKSSIVSLENKKFGIINLPKFYIDFSENNYRNSATDMAQEIERLKEENVEGLLIDLRNNGGGSLKTAIDIAGLFINEGPVVQVKYRGEKPTIHKDKDPKIQWNGPLVILVNEFSASASEIFAAAMQDYGRAIIIGSKQTFGKGTVQNILGLNRFSKFNGDLGALKMTIQKFYRINGGSTQLKGVRPDIILPTKYSYIEVGEGSEDNALAWDKVAQADYNIWNNYNNFNKVVKESRKRTTSNCTFKLIDANAKFLKEGQDDTLVYLNYEDYKKDIEGRIDLGKKFDSLKDYNNKLTFISPNYELPIIKKDSILNEKRTNWHTNLSKDIYIEESLHVLNDMQMKKKVALKN